MTQTVPEWNLQIADELRRMADDFAKAETAELPKPRMVSLNIQPGGPHNGADDEVIDTVNALGLALLGEGGEVEPMSNGEHFYRIEGRRGPVEFKVYREISDARAEQVKAGAVLAAKEKELARLRAEVAQLRGLGYTRADDEADDPTPVSPARVPLHAGAMTDEGLVDEAAF